MKVNEGWDAVEKGIAKFKRVREGLEPRFNSEEYMKLYSTIHDKCIMKDQRRIFPQLYDNYKQLLVDYINSTVLPSLREKQDECLLRDLVTSWSKYKEMGRWLSHLFSFIDRQAPLQYHVLR